MFVWVFHRLSGVLLIFLLSFQLLTGFVQASASRQELVKTFADWHRHGVLICLTVFLLVFHALYGLRTILLDLGVRREKLLFWCCNVLGLVLLGVFLVLYWTLVQP